MKSIDEVRTCAQSISKDLNDIGINYNFSPVVDMSPNATVGFRSFGAVPANIIPWSGAQLAHFYLIIKVTLLNTLARSVKDLIVS